MDRRSFLLGLPALALIPEHAVSALPTTPVIKSGSALLAGVTGFYVTVSSVNADAEADGLSSSAVKSFVIKRLQNSHVPIFSSPTFAGGQLVLNLFCDIETLKANGSYAFTTNLDVNDIVILANNPNVASLSAIWSSCHIGTVGEDNLSGWYTSTLGDDVDALIGAWSSVNG